MKVISPKSIIPLINKLIVELEKRDSARDSAINIFRITKVFFENGYAFDKENREKFMENSNTETLMKIYEDLKKLEYKND